MLRHGHLPKILLGQQPFAGKGSARRSSCSRNQVRRTRSANAWTAVRMRRLGFRGNRAVEPFRPVRVVPLHRPLDAKRAFVQSPSPNPDARRLSRPPAGPFSFGRSHESWRCVRRNASLRTWSEPGRLHKTARASAGAFPTPHPSSALNLNRALATPVSPGPNRLHHGGQPRDLRALLVELRHDRPR